MSFYSEVLARIQDALPSPVITIPMPWLKVTLVIFESYNVEYGISLQLRDRPTIISAFAGCRLPDVECLIEGCDLAFLRSRSPKSFSNDIRATHLTFKGDMHQILSSMDVNSSVAILVDEVRMIEGSETRSSLESAILALERPLWATTSSLPDIAQRNIALRYLRGGLPAIDDARVLESRIRETYPQQAVKISSLIEWLKQMPDLS